MKLETWTMTVRVTVDRDAISPRGWTPDDVAQAIDNVVSQMEGVANVECKQVTSPKSYECADDSPLLHRGQR